MSIDNTQASDDAWHLTIFKDRQAREKREMKVTDQEFADTLATLRAPKKERLPWVKVAEFGNKRTKSKCLRNNKNVIAIYGIEADYDGGEMPVSEVVGRLRQTGLWAIIATSPSHTAKKPRWRVYCRTSRKLPPEERSKLVNRINGVLGGVLAGESWTLSQAYYIGGIEGNPDHYVERVEGSRYIDEAADLDEGAIGKPERKPSNDNRDSSEGDGRLDVEALLEAIRTGTSYHLATVRLIGRWICEGVPQSDAESKMRGVFQGVAEADRDERWQKRYADIGRIVAGLYEKDARERAEAEAEDTVYEDAARLETPPSFSEWLTRPVPQPDYLLGSFMSTTSRIALSAATGIGKTMFGLEISFAIATGADFLHWKGSGKSRCVLYIDGEMSRGEMQKRLRELSDRNGGLIPDDFYVLSREDFDDLPALNTKAGQRYIDSIIKNMGLNFDLIVFDNVQCLLEDDDTYGKKAWKQTIEWVRKFTRDMVGQLWIHHAGSEKRAYGTITFTWQMDTDIILSEVTCPVGADIAFKLEFKKARLRRRETRADFDPVIVTLAGDQWSSTPETRRAESNNGAQKGPDAKQRAIELLKTLIEQDGAVLPATEGIPPETLCVTSKSWRERYVEDEFGREVRTDTAERAWRRAKEQLLAQGRIGEWGDWVWFIK